MAGIILDSYGKMVVEECEHGFDEAAKQKIHEFIQAPEPMTQEKNQQEIRIEHYQKFFENGTYERNWESGTEANYDMVDGRVNNQKKEPEKMVAEKPKKRRSVIKRLHEKQIAIAIRSGKPVPMYLEQQRGGERSRK